MDFAIAKDTIKEESKEEDKDLFFVDDDKNEIDAITPDQNLKKENQAINASLSDNKIEIVCVEKEEQQKQAVA